MAEPFLGEIKVVSFNFPPNGWALCNGQLLPINQNQALFSLLGTTYGGNGQTNFALPNLRGQVPIHMGSGHTLGEQGGTLATAITVQQLPQHTHLVTASSAVGDAVVPSGNLLASPLNQTYRPAGGGVSALATAAIASQGGSQPHNNMQPYLVLNFVIALVGIFPSQN